MTKKQYISNAVEMGIPKAEAEAQWDLKQGIGGDDNLEEIELDEFDEEDPGMIELPY